MLFVVEQATPKRASARSISVGGHTSVTANAEGRGREGGRPRAVPLRGEGDEGRPITPAGEERDIRRLMRCDVGHHATHH